MKVIQPPSSWKDFELSYTDKVIFLGGSIEMGTATLWQDRVIDALSNKEGTILNPRRDDWDSSWVQDPTPGTKFHEQVTWELDGQECADVLAYYFDPNTKSPITLLELGLALQANTNISPVIVVVYCPTTFWRYGNVKITCDRYGIHVYEDEAAFIEALRSSLV